MSPLRHSYSAIGMLAILLGGCSLPAASQRSASESVVPAPAQATAVENYIKHVVIIVQENRSFDNIFAGYPGAETRTFGYTYSGAPVPLRPTTFITPDIGHSWSDSVANYDQGRMDGFNLNTYYGSYNSSGGSGNSAGTFPYAYVSRSIVRPYWSMAQQYVLADHMFPTEMGGSFTAHLDLIAGTTMLTSSTAEVDWPSAQPWGCDAATGTNSQIVTITHDSPSRGPFPCFTQIPTIAPTLDAAKVTWRYYAPSAKNSDYVWTEFDAIRAIRYGPDWQNIVSPETTVLSDAANGNLPAVSWVIPDYANSDHAGGAANTGPSWVASVVNAIGESKYWDSTAIIVLWDDWGGWYDSVPPPQLDFVGLGIRVPCIIISPYAKHHYVSHTQYEFGSILKFVEEVYDLPSLGVTDVRANSLVDSLDFTRPPRKFKPISAPFATTFFKHEKHSLVPPDNE